MNPPNPLMIELKYGRFGLFLAHMHSRYHESSKTQKQLFFVKIAQKSYILFSEAVSMLIWNACFSYYHLETEKKLFHHFKRLKSSCIVWGCCLGVLEDSLYRLCIWAKKSPKTAILNSILSGFDGLKTVKRLFFSIMQITMGKNLSNAMFYILRGQNTASLKNFENLLFLNFFDKIQILKKIGQNSAFWYD